MFHRITRSPSLQSRDFRFLLVAAFLGSITRAEDVILGWVILELTDSPFMVGLALGIRHAPAFFLGVTAGTIADFIDRRKLLRILMILSTLTALVGGLLLLSDGVVKVVHLLFISAIGGTINMMFNTTEQSFVFDLVGRENGLNGMSYLGLSMRSGGTVAALGVGLVMARWGGGYAYFVIASACLLAVLVLGLIHSRGPSAPTSNVSMLEGISEFWRVIRASPTILALVMIVMFVELFGFTPKALFPSIARDVWHLGPGGLGLLSAFSSAGGILAIASISLYGRIRYQGIAFIAVILIFGLSILSIGFAPSFSVAIIAITVMSGMMALSDLFSQTILQRLVPNDLRGRVMGAWTMAVGTSPIGNLEIGALASLIGITIALAAHGGALILLGLIVLLSFRRLRTI